MITAIDKNTALILIDLQKGIVFSEKAHSVKDVLGKAVQLIDSFRFAGLPIVIVNVDLAGSPLQKIRKEVPKGVKTASMTVPSKDFTKIVDEIKTLPTDIFVTKKTWNAFFNTSLHEELQKRNITGIVLCGISTSVGVEGTARAASELGYNISFAIDAMTDTKIEPHQHSITNIFPRLGEIGNVMDIIEKLPEISEE